MEEEVERIMTILYAAYGTDTGYLFGIPPEDRYIVEAIVKVVLRILKGREG